MDVCQARLDKGKQGKNKTEEKLNNEYHFLAFLSGFHETVDSLPQQFCVFAQNDFSYQFRINTKPVLHEIAQSFEKYHNVSRN